MARGGIWDEMVRWPGKIAHDDRGNVAGDHYLRLKEDLDLMATIGLKACRFSFRWPRILPDGTGAANEAGLALYDRLVDALLSRGIEPWATACHWCLPLALHRRVGWINAESPRWFEDYIRVLAGGRGPRAPLDHLERAPDFCRYRLRMRHPCAGALRAGFRFGAHHPQRPLRARESGGGVAAANPRAFAARRSAARIAGPLFVCSTARRRGTTAVRTKRLSICMATCPSVRG